MSCWEQTQHDMTYKIYVTDALQAISENTTHLCGLNGVVDFGKSMTARWYDTIEPPQQEPTDDRTCNEIVADIWAKIQGKGGD